MKTMTFGVAILFILATLSCNKSSDVNIVPVRMLGWAVGLDFSGYSVIVHSSDSGKTWVRQGDSVSVPASALNDVCILDEKTVLVTGGTQPDGNYTVLKTRDGGKTWYNIPDGDLRKVNYYGLFALNMFNIWLVGDSGSVYHSTDAGENWTKLEIPASYQSSTFLRVAALTPDNIWVVGDAYYWDKYPLMLHSTDGGASWQRLNPLKDLNMTHTKTGHYLGIKLSGNSIWAIGGPGKFTIRSGNNGASWSDMTNYPSATADANDLFLLSESEAYIVTDYNGIYHTRDAGNSWVEYTCVTGDWYLGIAILNKVNIWVAGSPGAGNAYSAIVYSPDGGLTWQDNTPQFIKDKKSIALYKIRFMMK